MNLPYQFGSKELVQNLRYPKPIPLSGKIDKSGKQNDSEFEFKGTA